MSRSLSFSQQAYDAMEKMSRTDYLRIKKKLQYFISLDDPLSTAKPLIQSSLWSYRWRVGEWRIIFDIDREWHIIIVLVIGRRKDIYRQK